MSHSDYETIIGLEIHVELATKTKIFCGCSTSFGAPVNTHTCPVCLGMPGTIPVPNRQVVEDAIAIGLALGCEITRETRYDRKNYFYPDNPQNYQISQLYTPIGVNGRVLISADEADRPTGAAAAEEDRSTGGESERIVRIHEIHMEEDAGKLIHDESTGDTFVDYNRAGVPLIEIVTEPDMRSAEEVNEFITKLRTMLLYLGVSDCRMNEGSLRADVNLSVRKRPTAGETAAGGTEAAGGILPDATARPADRAPQPPTGVPQTYAGDSAGAFGTRSEMKNLNSFKAITRAIEAERDRQIGILEQGGSVIQETRRWDDEKGESFSMRSKEDAKDYRYFPDPDLPPIVIDETWIEQVRRALPEMPQEKAARYKKDYDLPDYDIGILTSEKRLADIFEKTVEAGAAPKKASNWLMGETMRIVNDRGMEADDITIDPQNLADLIRLTDNNTINSTTAKEIFEVIFDDKIDVENYVAEHGLAMVSDTSELERIILTILETNPKSVADYQAGKTKAIGFLVGQVMKETKGKANPELVRDLLEKALREA
ncbi:MAG: Asp-tRNA(Asn)/Glu-tRNA(Gln) amidotransferase subunit GatB [Eubacterium sp.]|nr:Asp-tRNA(Asn)/Glu-tRNA(Gln) amidotransferase subunit GatB [Eubacterium sp.]